jgi:peptide/nickel transport system substrate-binding protein
VGSYGIPKAMGNPHSSTSVSEMFTWNAIFDSLVFVQADGEVLPALALSWEPVDELTWHFTLRPGVTFSNGEPFDADAVVAVVEYIISDDAARLSVAAYLDSLAGASALDPLTVEIRTNYPNIVLPASLAMLRMHAPGQWARLGPEGFARDPVGTGPFVVDKWTSARIDLHAFTDSWRAPKVDRLEIYEILDSSARLQAVQTASVDIALNLSPDDIVALERVGGVGHVSRGAGVVGMSYITVKDTPFRDPRVRLALNHAVNRDPYIEVLLAGETVPASQPLPAGVPGYNEDIPLYDYNPEKAKKLLAEAGYPEGFKFVAEIVLGGSIAVGPIYQYLAQEFKKIGVDMEVRSVPVSQIIQMSVTGTWGGEAFGMEFNVKPSVDAMRAIRMHSCMRRLPWICDESVMPLILALRQEFDIEKRTAMIEELMLEYHERPLMLYLHETVGFDGLSSRVRNYDPVNRLVNYGDIDLVE